MRGGVSFQAKKSLVFEKSSPRAWGCFRRQAHREHRARVFPTCVGVFTSSSGAKISAWGCSPRAWGGLSSAVPPVCLPTVRRGVSVLMFIAGVVLMSSPRAWGCFPGPAWRSSLIMVFPTCVGVFLTCMSRASYSLSSSPRAWGCFWRADYRHEHDMVFPTCVGVFPLKI